MKTHLVFFVLALGVAFPTLADTLACPDLSTVVQIATCPSESELKYTFTGYCSDNARMYSKDTDTCTRYENYRKLKNIALWESADGAFQAYLSCDMPTGMLKQLKPATIRVIKKGKLTQLVCGYPEGIAFTHRTKAECKVPGSGNCTADPEACKASCN